MPRDGSPAHVRSRPDRVTLKDVAAIARVDPAVVSRVVNADGSLRITADTRSRVHEAIERTGYRPNMSARGLKTARTSTVGFVLPSVVHPVHEHVIRGVQRRADAAGYAVLLDGPRSASEPWGSFGRLLVEGRVDGLLVSTGVVADRRLGGLRDVGAPLVLVNRALPSVDSVVVDDAAGIELATGHLLELGHRRLGLVAGPRGIDTSQRRQRGFRSAVRGVADAEPAIVPMASWQPAAGHHAAARLLADHPDVTGLVVASSTAAAGVLHAARSSGRSVPEDLSVVALHDTPDGPFMAPPLTVVLLPLEEMGAQGFALILERLAAPGTPRTVMVPAPPVLLPRASTAPPRRVRRRRRGQA